MPRYHYECPTPDPWPDAVRIKRWPAIAVHILGYQTEPDEHTEWTGYESRTGLLVVRMVGDDALHLVDPDDVIPLDPTDYCRDCGQIGCGCNAYV